MRCWLAPTCLCMHCSRHLFLYLKTCQMCLRNRNSAASSGDVHTTHVCPRIILSPICMLTSTGVQIVEQVPPSLLPKVFAAVHDIEISGWDTFELRRLSTLNRSWGVERPLVRLLQLLPRTFHPAAVSASCRDAGDTATLSFHALPDDDEVQFAYDHLAGTYDTSLAFRLLAAAAPLAGSSLDHAWRDDGIACITRAGAQLRDAAQDMASLSELTKRGIPRICGMMPGCARRS